MLENLKTKSIKAAHTVAIKTKKHSPAIFMGVGVASLVGSTVLAVKATPKAMAVKVKYAEQKEEIEKVNNNREDYEEVYTDKDYRKDIFITYTQATVDYVKTYAPAITLGTFGIICIFQSHRILSNRNVAIATALKVTDSAFDKYRERVVDKFGEEVDTEMKHGIKTKKFKVKEVDEDGKESTKQTEAYEGPAQPSQYSRLFDQLNPNWQNNPAFNKIFLKAKQQYLNDMLIARGHVLLNDVYDELGIPRTKAGMVVGWTLKGDGDNYIDFGIYDIMYNPNKAEFINEREHSILLDFNVDGVIYDAF